MTQPTLVKVCRICSEEKLLDDFYVDRRTPDGRVGTCKGCRKKQTDEWRTANPGKQSAYSALWQERNQQAHQQRIEQRRKAEPEKERAGHLLRSAVRRGRMLRPDYCDQCGEQKRVDAHHEDYSKPYEVEWLCRSCHTKRHHEAKLSTALEER